jgi:hypothetical protein
MPEHIDPEACQVFSEDPFTAGKAQQSLIIAAKPDWGPAQWSEAAAELERQMEHHRAELERLHGRMEALNLYLIGWSAS